MHPLKNVRVLDLTTIIFGPLASQVLAEYGAEVIKVEPPAGDSTRTTGPTTEHGMSALFLGCNRNKKSVALDLKQTDAQAALQALMSTADVFMYSMRPQKLKSLGIDLEQLRTEYPRLICAGLHGFASNGPYSGRPAYDDVIQGMSGLADLMHKQSGEARYLPTIIADKTSALVAAHAILAALFQRERTGKGCFVEIPMFETMVNYNLVEHLYGSHFAPALTRMGYPRVLAPWRRPYKTLDGHVCMMPYTDAHWRKFFAEVGRPELADEARFKDITERTKNIESLLELASQFAAKKTSAYWLKICDRLEIPCAPVISLDALLDDPHLVATDFFEEVHDPAMGTIQFPAIAVRFDGQRLPTKLPPRLGEHTRDILESLGLPAATVDKLDARAGDVT